MSKNATIRARTDEALKHEVEVIFARIGLTTSQALNLFYHQIVLHNGLPFEVGIPNKTTRKAIEEARQGKTKSFNTANELFVELGINNS